MLRWPIGWDDQAVGRCRGVVSASLGKRQISLTIIFHCKFSSAGSSGEGDGGKDA